MSKVGTKHAAIASDPVQYLTNFGERTTLSEQDIQLAEKYLVRCWVGPRSTTRCDTFDQLRLQVYTSSVCRIDQLPPTSSSVRGHIHRAGYLVHQSCTLLTQGLEPCNALGVLDHGWEERFGVLLPSKSLQPLPESVLGTCKCTGKCDTRRCTCRGADVKCVMFCHGKNENHRCMNVS